MKHVAFALRLIFDKCAHYSTQRCSQHIYSRRRRVGAWGLSYELQIARHNAAEGRAVRRVDNSAVRRARFISFPFRSVSHLIAPPLAVFFICNSFVVSANMTIVQAH